MTLWAAMICVVVFFFESKADALGAKKDTSIINTSFESTDTPPYSLGTVAGQNLWTNTGGVGSLDVVNSSAYVYSGSNGLKMFANNVAIDFRHTAYSGTVAGISGIVYLDVYVKIFSEATREFAICGFDLYGTSAKRTFVVEFTIPTNDTGSVRVYNGSTKTRIIGYQLNTWHRVSIKIDYANAKYTTVVNGSTPVMVNFRDSYTPTASGTRQAGIKEYHQLRLNLGGGSYTDGASGSVDAAVDQLYAGTTAPAGVDFGDVVYTYTVSVTQPLIGNIALNPIGPTYNQGTEVTATLSVPTGYKNYGWTGALSGSELVKIFTVNSNISIGANVWIDSTNPPPLYTVTAVQPAYGTIALSPGSLIYAGLKDTATLTVPEGYKNYGWTGDLSGTELIKIFIVNNNMTFSANVDVDTTIPPGTRKTFSTASSFKSALSSAVPGDTIELVDGTYDITGNTITKSGTSTRPILIRAQNRNGVVLNGTSRFTLSQAAHVTIEGFVFTSDASTVIKTEACNNIRITRNIFRLSETSSSKWILIGGRYNIPTPNSHHNRIDHNLFENKYQLGNYITIDGSPANIDGSPNPQCAISQYDRIDHNHFRNMGPRAVNEMEAIRIGVSYMSMTSSYLILEYNMFDSCDGDPEIISVKSCDNILRYNTFRGCQGTVSLRSGNRNTIEGNFIFGNGKEGTGGVRIYGDDHKIFNNYMEGLTGGNWDAGITITNGDVDSNSTDYTAHFRPKRAVFAFNTLVNNAHNIEIGYTNNGNYNKAPRDITMANNLVVGSQNELVKIITNPINMNWTGNVMYPTGSATLGITASPSQIKVVDPLLSLSDGLWKLTESSPARDSAVGTFTYVNYDVDGQYRAGPKDIGADEYSTSSVVNYPLTPLDVGPNSTTDGGELPVQLAFFNAYYIDGTNVTLEWETISEKNNFGFYVQKYNPQSLQFVTLWNSFQAGETNSVKPKYYSWADDDVTDSVVQYRLLQIDNDGLENYFGPIIVSYNPTNVKETFALPDKYDLTQNYPNPFNPSTIISLQLPVDNHVTLKVYNTLGQEVATLVSGFKKAGKYRVEFDASNLTSGIYIYRLVTSGFTETKKMIIIR